MEHRMGRKKKRKEIKLDKQAGKRQVTIDVRKCKKKENARTKEI